jgi:hypothetical protein
VQIRVPHFPSTGSRHHEIKDRAKVAKTPRPPRRELTMSSLGVLGDLGANF